MTLRTSQGRSLAKVYFANRAELDWQEKLFNNVRTKLDRVGDIVMLAPSSLRPGRGIALYFSGTDEHRARIEKALDVIFDTNLSATVKFSRIETTVKLLARPQLVSRFMADLASAEAIRAAKRVAKAA